MCPHDPSPHDQHSIAQFHQKKIFRPGFLHSSARRESKGSSPLNGIAWIHALEHAHLHTALIYAYVYTTLAICKIPHLAQTDQARLIRFFALPDSNTSTRVTISVLAHVVVSPTCMEQVPYAAVTGKYVRALMHRHVHRGYGHVWRHVYRHVHRGYRHVWRHVQRCRSGL